MGIAERRHREKEERRSAILDAAEEVFLEKGLAGTTMDEIARAVELSKGTLYLYFSGKDELYLGVVMRSISEVALRVETAVRQGGSGLSRLKRLMAAKADFAMQHRRRFLVAVSWMGSQYSVDPAATTFEQYRTELSRIFEVVIECIERGRLDGSIRQDVVPSRVAFQLWGSLLGTLILFSNAGEVARRLPQAPANFEDMVRDQIGLLLRGLAADNKEEM